jgi:DNA-binding NtrC family response regulator
VNGSELSVIMREEQSYVSGVSPAIRAIEDVIAEIASTNIPVLLVGESGTGKQIFAHRIHSLSPRRQEALIKITCASMTGDTFAAELGLKSNGNSGHRAEGTVFFDEISELDAACQRSLLCALPDDDVAPHTGQLTARVISTTSRNLDEEMRAGRFRNELYYRINGVCLRLPPLRERREDIADFIEFFLTKHSAQLARPRPALSARSLGMFLNHSWPGNIRELENAVKKIVAVGDEQLAVSELVEAPPEARPAAVETRVASLKDAARAASRGAERGLILEALARTHWNRKRAAQELRISYKSLLYKLKQIGMEETEAR